MAYSTEKVDTILQHMAEVRTSGEKISGDGDLSAPRRGVTLPTPSVLERVGESWLLEGLGLVAAAGALGGIVVLLNMFNRQPYPTWNGISFSAAVSFLSTVASLGSIYAAKNGLDQLKWIWFTKQPRRLADVVTFTNASGGLWGALELLWDLRARHFAVFATLALIIAVVADAFTQDVIHPYEQIIVDFAQGNNTARLARVMNFTIVGPMKDGSTYFADPLLSLNAESTLLLHKFMGAKSSMADFTNPMFFCSTGNCTWGGPIDTLAFCSQCSDVTPQLSVSCPTNGTTKTCRASLPNDGSSADFNGDTRRGTLMDTKDVELSRALIYKNMTMPSNFTNVFQSVRVVENTPGKPWNATFKATECQLSACVMRIRPSVVRGNYTEVLLATHTEDFSKKPADPNSLALHPPWTPDGQNFGMSTDALRSLSLNQFLQSSIVGRLLTADGGSGAVRFEGGQLEQGIYYAMNNGECANAERNPDAFACVMAAFTKSLTKTMRDSQFYDNTHSDESVYGDALVSVTFIRADWAYLALPLVVWAFSAITWIGTVWMTWRARLPKWKGNLLPLVYLYRDDYQSGVPVSSEMGLDHSNAAYDYRAENLRVRLEVEKNGQARLVKEGGGRLP